MTLPEVHIHQILRVKHEASCLYAEVVQIIPARNLYWLRPLALINQEQPPSGDASECLAQGLWEHSFTELYDLRQGPDLLIPQTLCQPALDTEVLPLLTELEGLKDQRNADLLSLQQTAQQQLQSLMRQLYQAHPSVFQIQNQLE